jgi:hypothetical protein
MPNMHRLAPAKRCSKSCIDKEENSAALSAPIAFARRVLHFPCDEVCVYIFNKAIKTSFLRQYPKPIHEHPTEILHTGSMHAHELMGPTEVGYLATMIRVPDRFSSKFCMLASAIMNAES